MTTADDVMPIIDLARFVNGTARERRRIAARVDEVCRGSGFLIITGHRVPESTLESAWQAAADFFDLPLIEKMRYAATEPSEPRGYFPMERETLSRSRDVDTPPDLKEAFSCGRLTSSEGNDKTGFFHGPNIWPSRPIGFRRDWETYYQAMERLSDEIMSLFAVALGLPDSYFRPYFNCHASALRALNYPPPDRGAKPLQQRAGAHSDYGSLTVLKPDPCVAGLEIQLRDGTWFSAPLVENDFIINIGDLMSRWTNGRWTSTTHRVTVGQASQPAARRQSIAFFQNPNADAVIECLPGCQSADGSAQHTPVAAGRYLEERFTATMDGNPE